MKNMEKILWTCWMECSPLSFLTPVIKVSLQLGMLLASRHFTLAGVLMVCNFNFVCVLQHCFALYSGEVSWRWFFLDVVAYLVVSLSFCGQHCIKMVLKQLFLTKLFEKQFFIGRNEKRINVHI